MIKVPTNLLIQTCGKNTYARGVDYAHQNRVIALLVNPLSDDIELHGRVKGSGNQRYTVSVDIVKTPRNTLLEGNCSCPVGYDCKHVVALCLHYNNSLEDMPDAQPRLGLNNGPALPQGLCRWLDDFAASSQPKQPRADQNYPVYILTREQSDLELYAQIWMTRPRKNGHGFVKGQAATPEEVIRAARYPDRPQFADALDLETCQLLSGLSDPYYYGLRHQSIALSGKSGALALENMIKTKRCLWQDKSGDAVSWGEPRDFYMRWEKQENGYQLVISPNAFILPTEPALYWDEDQRQVGKAQLFDEASNQSSAQALEQTHAHPPENDPNASLMHPTAQQIRLLQQAPPIPLDYADAFTEQLTSIPAGFPLSAPVKIEATDIHLPPTGYITLGRITDGPHSAHCLWYRIYYGEHQINFLCDQATPLLTQSADTLEREDAVRVRVHRDIGAEQALTERLTAAGFHPIDITHPQRHQPDPLDHSYNHCLILPGEDLLDSANRWHHFLTHDIPALEAAGWVIDQDEQFRMVFFEGDWHAQAKGFPEDDDAERPNDWFDVRFDLTLENNKTLPLAPIIAPLMGRDPESLPESIVLPLGDDQYTHLKTERLKPYLDTLTELFQRENTKDDTVALSRFDLSTMDELGGQLLGAEQLQEIAQRVKGFTGISAVKPPKGLKATLRPYQQQGLNWLQFLRQYQFNGILADDMGLGKTLQSIAHILTEKQAGRLTSPALIIAPTSLMGNWRQELEKFAPALSVIIQHGKDRHDQYDALESMDVVVTTYALAHRDLELLKTYHFHLLILDEAQAIKNPKAKIAHAVRELPATHRLCLTGTPMENHLGELWALFDFLMPGFLATNRHFKEFYRSPIEKHADQKRLGNLQKRVSPFILRRNKSEVAKELPPKTEIQHLIALDRAQSKLYESIRVTMDKQVRDAIAKKGLAQSHITVLDALLKLRQTCCDPRLLKMANAASVEQSAKMEALLELLEQLLSEDRRVLIFSQFTSMLTLIEAALKERRISLTKLTGKTRHREKAIDAFRSGKADVFLISLKAGGMGLNLVEADTVIIYDPWWNPAAENQAIDRAHRIGQDKPVFVYRLIVENSVEEKILKLQTHKKALADGIYDEENVLSSGSLDAETIQALFAPMGGK